VTASQVLFGVPIDPLTMDQAVEVCVEHVNGRQQLLVGVVNAAKLVTMRRDPALRASLMACEVILADGQSVVWASWLLRRPLPERVTGIDLFTRLLEVADRDNHSVYLLGATAEVVALVAERIGERYPGVKVAGARDGYYTPAEERSIAEDIRNSGADMLFLGMGSPKKEMFLRDWADFMGVPILHGVGGSFDILAGVTRRAPRSWQKFGMEWAYRLHQEPARLWQRYLYTNTAFVGMTLTELVRRRPELRPSTSYNVEIDLRDPRPVPAPSATSATSVPTDG
jgi:N-acetylglucosaminyldiphosphoundecaprenol N-acetyl-beta-D-mannosaminyltransferase